MALRFALVLAVAFLSSAFGDPAYFANKRGNDYYKKGDFQKALDEYSVAHFLDSKSGEINFNLGQTLFELGKYPESAKAFGEVFTSETGAQRLKNTAVASQAAALYKAGSVALDKNLAGDAVGYLEKSVDAYKYSVRQNASDEKLLKGLELAVTRLEEARKRASSGSDNKNEPNKNGDKGDSQSEKDKKDSQDKNAPSTPSPSKDKKEGDKESKEQPAQAEANKDGNKGEGKDDGGASGNDEVPQEMAGQILSAVTQDEKALRAKVRNRLVKEQPKAGKDW